MHQLLVLYSSPDDLEAFRRYYMAVHLPLARKLPGLISAEVVFPQPLGAQPSPWFCIFTARFADEAAMMAALQPPAGEAAAADIPNFSLSGATLLHA